MPALTFEATVKGTVWGDNGVWPPTAETVVNDTTVKTGTEADLKLERSHNGTVYTVGVVPLRFATGQLPDDATITAAQLQFYARRIAALETAHSGTTSRNINVAEQAWTASGVGGSIGFSTLGPGFGDQITEH